MSGFDPEAATTAYLDQIPRAMRQGAGAAGASEHLLSVVLLAVIIAACWGIARSGILRAIQRRYAAAASGPFAAALGAGAVAALIALASAPVILAQVMLTARRTGVPATLPALAVHLIVPDLLLVVASMILAPAIHAVMKRLPRAWPFWIGGAGALVIFGLSWLPGTLASGPGTLAVAPPGALRDSLVALLADGRIPASVINLTDNPGDDADVTGTQANARVIVSKGLWSRGDAAQIRARLGHVMGHFAHHDDLWLAVLMASLVFGGPLAAQLMFRPVARAFNPGQHAQQSDPAAIPITIAILAVYLALTQVGINNFIRLINVRADAYSLAIAREPDGLAKSLIDDWRANPRRDSVSPALLGEVIFYDHPALRSRILHAMRWKAAHQKQSV